jgi:hypothetical protein
MRSRKTKKAFQASKAYSRKVHRFVLDSASMPAMSRFQKQEAVPHHTERRFLS